MPGVEGGVNSLIDCVQPLSMPIFGVTPLVMGILLTVGFVPTKGFSCVLLYICGL